MRRKKNDVHLDDEKILGIFFSFLFVYISKLHTIKHCSLLTGLKIFDPYIPANRGF